MTVQELFDLKGKIAVVTGGSGIYGKPISEALAEAGAKVIVASRTLDRCRQWADELRSRTLDAEAEQFDQGSEKSITEFRKRLIDKFGKIDILVNNSVARIMNRYEEPAEYWAESMKINSTGLFIICRQFLNEMMKNDSGNIINIGSVQGVVAPVFENYEGLSFSTPPDYHYNKHGMIGLNKYLAALGGKHKVRVNTISPGGFCENKEDIDSVFYDRYCKKVFLNRMAKYDDIKGAVVFLASEASSYITGQNIILDGGYSC